MHMAIHHPRHDELACRIEHLHIATSRGDRRGGTDSRNAVALHADDAIPNDRTANRIEDGTADELHAGHRWLLPRSSSAESAPHSVPIANGEVLSTCCLPWC